MEGYGYSDAWKAIIRPPRDEYTEADLGTIAIMSLHNYRSQAVYDWEENISTN